jgi:hypothetical protein
MLHYGCAPRSVRDEIGVMGKLSLAEEPLSCLFQVPKYCLPAQPLHTCPSLRSPNKYRVSIPKFTLQQESASVLLMLFVHTSLQKEVEYQ